ncbi:unnamed protein product [Lepidochelys olivacea]
MKAATAGSAGLDLIMQEDADFQLPGEVCAIPTQVTGPLPDKFLGLVLPRSHAGKQGFFVIPGVIDADYTGFIKVQVWTHLPESLLRGRSIAQLILVPYQVPLQRIEPGAEAALDRRWLSRLLTTRPLHLLL